MADRAIYKRDYFRIDALLPMQANSISPDMSHKLQSRICEQKELRPGVVNISGGGISFKSITEYTVGDTLELFFTLIGLNPITVCVYGKVLRVVTTAESHYQIYVKFVIISDKMRDMIVSFVFLREREIIKNNQLAAYDNDTVKSFL
jgi:c-di-GMP-binding flagellar brake protein YcgR